MPRASPVAASAGVGLGFLSHPRLGEMVHVGQEAENTGYVSLWVAETQNRRDAITATTTLLQATEHARVGTAAINVYTRNAGLVGLTFATLAETYGSRVVAGLGIGSASTLERLGIDVTHPIGRLSEYVDVVRAVTRGPAPVNYTGRYVLLDDLVHGALVTDGPAVYLCVGGQQGLQLAARKADGVVLDLFLPQQAIAHMVRTLHKASQDKFDGTIAAGIMVSIEDDVAAAMDNVRPILARYLLAFPELVREMGIDSELLQDVAAAQRTAGDSAAARLLDDDLVDEISVCGPPARCRSIIRRYLEAGVTQPILFPEPDSLLRAASEPLLTRC